MSVEIHVPTNDEIEQMSVDELRRASWNLLSQFQLVKGAMFTIESQMTKELDFMDKVLDVVRENLGLIERNR